MSKKPRVKLWIILPVLLLAAIGLYLLPPIQQRVNWRLASLQTQIFYWLNPPDQVSLAQEEQIDVIVKATWSAITRQQTEQAVLPTITPPVVVETQIITPTPTIEPTPAPTATPLPSKVVLSGIQHEYQSFNNCGPVNLSMALGFWGWQGNQNMTKQVLRPNEDDSNVMVEEMANYVTQQTGLQALVRYGGSQQLLKDLIAAGFPVIIESGHQPPKDWWMGHYVVVSGYDDSWSTFITQDSLIMPDLPLPYEEMAKHGWRDFNYVYLVIYPASEEEKIISLLGADYDPLENLNRSLQNTEAEIPQLAERDLFFAWFNHGALLQKMGDAQAAAASFDLAFAQYDTLTEDQRPWRVLWYRVEPYQAYYETGRYQSVIDLANATLSMLSKRGLEETHFWRGLAYEALGQNEKAIFDYEIALQLRPTYAEAQQALLRVQGMP